MSRTYDYIIVGGGPAGLTMASMLSQTFKVLLVEREATLGGCHRVRRDEKNYFGEHGPRVYSGCYQTVHAMLNHLGVQWDDIFKHTSFSPDTIDGRRWFQYLSVKEMLALSYEFLIFALADSNRGTTESVDAFCSRWSFSEESKRAMNLTCRRSEGASSSRYPMNTFLQGFNQHMLYPFYQARAPLDTTLFSIWKTHLVGRGVDILLGRAVEDMDTVARTITIGDTMLKAKRGIICAIPPENLVDLCKRSHVPLPSGFEDFAEDTEYEEYLNVTYHLKSPLPPTFKMFRNTPWGVIYMPQFEEGSVLSTSACLLNVPSPRTGKTAHQSSRKELAAEILAQITETTGVHLDVKHIVVSSGLHHEHSKWDDDDTAFVKTHCSGYWPAFEMRNGLYTVGTHTGRSTNAFTSMESAIQNALHLVHDLHPELSHTFLKSRSAWTIKSFLFVVFAVMVAMIIVRKKISW